MIRNGQQVEVISGKDKGKKGNIISVVVRVFVIIREFCRSSFLVRSIKKGNLPINL